MKGKPWLRAALLAFSVLASGCAAPSTSSPENADRLYDEAQKILAEDHDPSAALQRLDRILLKHPDHIAALNLRAAVHRILDRPDAAVKDYRRLLPLLPRDPTPRYNLALLLNEQSRLEEAENSLTEAIDLSPAFIQALLLRSDIRIRLGRQEEGLQDLETARETGKTMANTFHNQGLQHAAARRMNEAFRAFNICLQLEPDHYQGRLARGNLHMKRGNFESALADFSHIDTLFPDNYDILVYQGSCLIQMERYEEAHGILSRAIAVEPDRTHAWMLRGILHANVRNDPDQAERDFRRVLEIDDQSDEAHEALGLLYQNQDLLGQAERELLLALGLRSTPERLHLLSRVYRDKKNLSSAAEALRIAVKTCSDEGYRTRLQKELDEIEETLSRPLPPSKEPKDEPADPR